MTLPSYFEKTLDDLCDVFGISQSAASRHPSHALGVLSALYGYRLVEGDDNRHKVRDGALQDTVRVWGEGDPFTIAVRRIVADFGARLAGSYPIPMGNHELIMEFRSLARITAVLAFVGIGAPLSGSAKKGIEEGIKSGSVRSALRAARSRLLYGGGSAIAEATVARLGITGPWGLALVGATTVTYAAMVARMEQIRSEIMRRHENGEATDEEVAEVQNKSLEELAFDTLVAYWQ